MFGRWNELAALLKVETYWSSSFRTARPGATGGIPGPCPPQMTACASQTKIMPPPKRGLWPEETNRVGATGVQIEAQIGVFVN